MNDSTLTVACPEPAPPATLDDLATAINEHHRQAELAIRSGLDHALAAGRLLIEAKALCQHGDWGSWLDANFEGSQRTARAYMQVARRWPEIEAKRQSVADLGFGDAVKLLADNRAKDEPKTESASSGARPFHQAPPEDRHDMCVRWWDILATQTLLYDAAGRSANWIAEFCGMPLEDVTAILDPAPPLKDFQVLDPRAIYDASRDFKKAYYHCISTEIDFQIGYRYLHAAENAAREGFPGLKSQLGAMHEHYWRRWERYRKATEAFAYVMAKLRRPRSPEPLCNVIRSEAKDHGIPNREELWIMAMMWCVTEDMRHALRIQTWRESYFDRFDLHFVHNLEVFHNDSTSEGAP